MRIINNRIIIFDNEICNFVLDPKNIKGARFYKKDAKWSFPMEQMDRFVKKENDEFFIGSQWFEIFPNFKILKNIL